METLERPKAQNLAKAAPTKEEVFPELEGTDVIVIKAKSPDQLPSTARPCFDKTGRIFTGQGHTGHFETLSDQQKRDMNYVITPETSVVLTSDKIFDMTNPVDKANWRWLRRHPYIAMSKKEMEASRDAVYYVHNPVAEAARRVVDSKIKDKARYLIQYESNRDTLVRAAKVLGHMGADTLTDSMLQDYLLQQVEAPGMDRMVLDAVSAQDSELIKAKVMLSELTKYRMIQRGDAGLYRFGGEKGLPLGHTEELVLQFITDDKNADSVLMMKNALTQRKQQPVE